jgi:hypothetical protein
MLSQIKRRHIDVFGRFPARPDQIVNAGQRAVGQHRRELNGLTIQRATKFIADFASEFGVVAVTWHEQLCGGEAAKWVTAKKDSRTLPFLKAMNP